MSKEMKMSDVFELPLFVESEKWIGSENFRVLQGIHDDDPDNRLMILDYATQAINNHDRLTQENQQLREAFGDLYEAFYDEYSSGVLTIEHDLAMLAAKQLLSKLESKDD